VAGAGGPSGGDQDDKRNERVSHVLSDVAHALNNPLGSIVLAAGLLRDDPTGPLATELAESIEAEALRAADILSDLRVFSDRPGGHQLQRTAILDLLIEASGGRIGTVEGGTARAWLIEADAPRMVLVLKRLFDESTGTEPLVASIREENAGATVSATIRPAGRAPGPLPGAVSDFRLAMARVVAADHGGSVEATTDSEGNEGWLLRFPLAREAGADEERRVLVVDDNAALVSMLTMLLERDGWAVTSTYDPLAVVSMVSEEHPHIVLVDFHLGTGSGLDVAEAVEQAHPYLAGRVAVVTGDRTADLKGREALYKPFRWADLDLLLRRLVPADR